jgi:hypothetical protein
VGRSGFYQVDLPLPAERRFVPGLDALVYSQRHNARFVYVGLARNLKLDRLNQRLTFESFERLKRPVVIDDVDYPSLAKDKVYPADKGFFREFAYIDESKFLEAVRLSQRPAEPVPSE